MTKLRSILSFLKGLKKNVKDDLIYRGYDQQLTLSFLPDFIDYYKNRL